MTTFNSANIERLERLIGDAGETVKAIGKAAGAAGRVLSASEHARIEAARAEIQKLSLKLQHEKALAGAFGQRY